MEQRCIGCGSILQSSDQNQAGYVPQSKLGNEDIICRRCFRLKNYNEVLPVSLTQEDYFKRIATIADKDALIVKLIDIFDIEGSIIPQIQKLTNHNDMVIIANKVDLLPKSVKENKLKHHLKKIIADNNLKVLDIFIMSAIKNKNMDQIMQEILNYAKGRDIYIVGATNVGKSTFINQILRNYTDQENTSITVSKTAGTTLDFIEIPVEDFHIIDTPGLMNSKQITHYISQKTLKLVTPKNEIKPKNYQLQGDQTLFIGGLARIDFSHQESISSIVYISEQLSIHRTKTVKADDLYKQQLYSVLKPPFEGEDFPLKQHTFHIKDNQKYDLVLPGLGFVTIKGKTKIKVYVHESSTPYIREALI